MRPWIPTVRLQGGKRIEEGGREGRERRREREKEEESECERQGGRGGVLFPMWRCHRNICFLVLKEM